ncbi:MAG: bifunctional 2-polyprenyl-6-hydroxyphenol methylase/3-demethylubiquinol 3-O-methyltransferase UbiG [Gammaproteobacteria bacterium]|nr:bifunctional 2-polyprenyl-6-hydroxyphenol methylase/3-demethylubiquinol 3-O-methyltransferase UbiG [Gammaproteobacteria bacterium]
MRPADSNVDPAEVARFNALASRWWDPKGEMRMLHRMNPVRLAWIAGRATLAGVRCLDIGCGAGLLSEGLARAGADVTGIDLAEDSLAVARLHQAESELTGLRYRQIAAEDLAAEAPASFDVVTCLEMLEHVPEPASVVAACARLVRPGGRVFFSTINRHPRALAEAVIAAEYVFGILPRGTHDWNRFIRPSELDRWARSAGLELQELAGLRLDAVSRRFTIVEDVRVNYLACFHKRGP